MRNSKFLSRWHPKIIFSCYNWGGGDIILFAFFNLFKYMRSLLLLLASVIFIIQSIGWVHAYSYVSEEGIGIRYTNIQGSQDIPIFEQDISWPNINDGWTLNIKNALISQCKLQRQLSTNECQILVEQRIQSTLKAVRSKNSSTLRRAISQGNLYWLNSATLWESDSYSDIISIKRYQDGFLFISATDYEGDPSKYHFGYIRSNMAMSYLRVFMVPIAQEWSTQYNAYSDLYYIDQEFSDFDKDQFQKDLKKSFNKNRFNNKETQEVYSQFLKFVDENTPAR